MNYNYDIVYKNIKYDVKTKRCTSPPKSHYECSVAAYNTKQKCDRYAFVRIEWVNGKWGRAWVLGWLEHDEYFEKAEAVHPTANEDATLRWNTCARMIMDNNLQEQVDDSAQVMLE